jgi:hypothetical protein
MKQILFLKHWQVFIFMIIPFAINIIFLGIDFNFGNISSTTIAVISSIIYLIIFFSWILAIGLFISSIPDNPYHLRKVIFIIAVFFSLIGYSKMNLSSIVNVDTLIPEWTTIILIPLSIWGTFYTFYSVSRAFKSVEIGRKAKFTEYILDAILLFVPPIGVWIIQPRIEKIVKNVKVE